MAEKKISRPADAPLSERERELLRRLFRWEEMPPAFKAALTDHVSVNGSLHVSSMPTLKGEEWREVGATGQPGFQNSWVNFAAGNETAGFMKDALGFVHLKGLIKSGTQGTVAFTLPEGYLPSLYLHFAILSNNILGRVTVDTSGNVAINEGGIGSNVWANLDGINFRAA